MDTMLRVKGKKATFPPLINKFGWSIPKKLQGKTLFEQKGL